MRIYRKADLADKYKISLDRLTSYEIAGVLTPIVIDSSLAYASEGVVSTIAKAEALGFSFDEVVMLIGPRARW